MRATADVIVIGGGIVGVTTAYNLAKLGVKNVMLVERATLGAGSTGRSSALVRMHYSNEVTVRMALLSREVFLNFADAVGGECGYQQTGWLFLVPETHVETMKQMTAMQRRVGVDLEVLKPQEVPLYLKGAVVDNVAAAVYEPRSGYADPALTTSSYAEQAKALGAEINLNTEVTDLIIEGERIQGVVTNQGRILAPVIIDAAGPWAYKVGRMAGLELPLQVTREQDTAFHVGEEINRQLPAVSDMCNRVYFRREGKDLLLIGRGHPKETEFMADPDDPLKEKADEWFVDYVTEKLLHRLPHLENASFVRGWAGMYTVTPDWHPILGFLPGIQGMYAATGLSGHGFKLAPVMGQCVAEAVLNGGKASTLDISMFRPTRFAEDDLVKGGYAANRG